MGLSYICLNCCKKANTCGDQCFFLLKPSVVKGKHKQQKSTPRRKVTSIKRHKKSLCITRRTLTSAALTRALVVYVQVAPVCAQKTPVWCSLVWRFLTSPETLQNIEAKILDNPYDFILGRPHIKRYNMLDRNMFQFRVKSNELEPSLTERDPALKASSRCRVDSFGYSSW